MPRAKERSEMDTAVVNFAGREDRDCPPRSHREKGGTIVDSPALADDLPGDEPDQRVRKVSGCACRKESYQFTDRPTPNRKRGPNCKPDEARGRSRPEAYTVRVR